MDFSEVVGSQHIKSHLIKTVENGRIPHAQLFSGANGSGLLPMAIAYASELLCAQYDRDSELYKQCQRRVKKLEHPDLHFVYPVNTNTRIKKNAVSDDFSSEWRKFVLDNPYGSLFDWLQSLGIENKQGNISTHEAERISKKLALKPYDGGYKVMIIWMAEHMNMECGNKILKQIEEPADKTVLILLTEREDRILTTIRSRCQKLTFPMLAEADIAENLIRDVGVSESDAAKTAARARGNYHRALQLIEESGTDAIFEEWFILWVRTAFKAKGNKGAIEALLNWSDTMATQGRETQKSFLRYCIEIFRQALLKNYKSDSLVYFEAYDSSFSLEKFAPFVHQNNIFDLTEAIEEAYYHIERNGNAKIIFTDLSIKLTRYIHKKSVA